MSLLSLSAIDVSFGGPKVLSQVGLQVSGGERWAVLGPNGAGKSSLVRVALGLLKPDAGEVAVKGRPLASYAREELARTIAWVPQSPAESLGFSVLEVVLMGLSSRLGPWGVPSAGDVSRAHAVLGSLGVDGLAGRSVDTLSGGERRLVWLARAVVQGPTVLLLDEPTAFLDVRHQLESLRRVKQAVVEGECQAAIAVLHDVNLAAGFATHALLLREGRVIGSGPVAQTLTEETLGALYGVQVVRGAAEVFSVRGA